MKFADELARAFITEQSDGWGEQIETADAIKLAGVIRSAQAEAYSDGQLSGIEAAALRVEKLKTVIENGTCDQTMIRTCEYVVAIIRALSSETRP